MKAVTLRFDPKQFQELNEIKAQGFASINEVIKCAALSFAAAAPENSTRPPSPENDDRKEDRAA
jgi:hypothetical protein